MADEQQQPPPAKPARKKRKEETAKKTAAAAPNESNSSISQNQPRRGNQNSSRNSNSHSHSSQNNYVQQHQLLHQRNQPSQQMMQQQQQNAQRASDRIPLQQLDQQQRMQQQHYPQQIAARHATGHLFSTVHYRPSASRPLEPESLEQYQPGRDAVMLEFLAALKELRKSERDATTKEDKQYYRDQIEAWKQEMRAYREQQHEQFYIQRAADVSRNLSRDFSVNMQYVEPVLFHIFYCSHFNCHLQSTDTRFLLSP